MTTRREFLQAGIAVSALPLGTTLRAVAPAGTEDATPRPAFYRVVFDERVAESVAFAAGMRRRGATLEAIQGDITRFWYRELQGVWERGPAAVAGLTAHGPLFCLEQLARDYRMRVAFRAEHRFGPRACVAHHVSAPAAIIGSTARLTEAGAAWPSQVADIISRCSHGRPISSASVETPNAHRRRDGDEPLYSWVIVPAPSSRT